MRRAHVRVAARWAVLGAALLIDGGGTRCRARVPQLVALGPLGRFRHGVVSVVGIADVVCLRVAIAVQARGFLHAALRLDELGEDEIGRLPLLGAVLEALRQSRELRPDGIAEAPTGLQDRVRASTCPALGWAPADLGVKVIDGRTALADALLILAAAIMQLHHESFMVRLRLRDRRPRGLRQLQGAGKLTLSPSEARGGGRGLFGPAPGGLCGVAGLMRRRDGRVALRKALPGQALDQRHLLRPPPTEFLGPW